MTVGLKSTPIHETLRRVVVWFRVLAFVWMGGLVISTLLDDPRADRGWVLTAWGVALAATIGTTLMARANRLDAWWWVAVDGAAIAFIVVSPGLAQSRHLFFGGMGLSWLLVVVWAYPSVIHGAVAVATLVGAQLIGSELGIREIELPDLVGDVAVWIVSGIVYGWALWALRVTDVGRQEAEARLADERMQKTLAEARSSIADDIHDSVLQTLGYIQVQARDPEIARIAVDQDRELRRYLDRLSAEFPDGLEVSLRTAAWEVEDRYGVPIHVVCVRDTPRDDGVDALVAAAREAMTNAAKHSGAESISVYAEVLPDSVAVFVRDRGDGFEAAGDRARHRGIDRSIVGRIERVGGSARVSSVPGRGTEVELTLPGGLHE